VAGALQGIKILDLTWGVAGPLGVLMLAEQGAEVVKIEPPDGDPFRMLPGAPVWLRSRKSVVLNLKQESGREALLRLIETADVIVESFSPGTMDDLGLSYEVVSARNPNIIYASLQAYPHGHRYEKRAGWDALVQARSGAQFEQPAWRPGPAHLHMQIPSMGAFFLLSTAILAALYARENIGRGQHVRTSLFQGVLAYTTMLWQDVENLHAPDSLIMAKTSPPGVHQTSIFECANGEWMHAGVNVGRVATSTMEHILGVEAADQARLMTDPVYRLAHTNTLRAAFIHRDRTELCTTFFDAGIGADPILSPVEMYDYPQFRANNMAVQVEDPELGVMTQVGIAPVLVGTPGAVQGPRPVVGADTRDVLESAGFTAAEIDTLIQSTSTASVEAGE